MGLIARLRRIQEAHGWTDQEMADHIGISRPMWSAARSGKRLGHRALGPVLRAFPELAGEVVSYLAETPPPVPTGDKEPAAA